MFTRAVLSFAVTAIMSSTAHGQFWHAVDGAVSLTIDSSKITMRFEGGIGSDSQESIISQVDRIEAVLSSENGPNGFVVCSLNASSSYLQFLDSLQAVSGVETVEPYYLWDDSIPKLVGNRFIVRLSQGVSSAQIDSINTLYGIQAVNELWPGVWVLRNTP